MNVKIIPFLIARLTSLYFLYQAFIYLGALGVRLSVAGVGTQTVINACIMIAVTLALSLGLWKKAEWLAVKIMGRYGEDNIAVNVGFYEIQTLVFICFGVFLLVMVFPYVVRDVYTTVLVAMSDKSDKINLWPGHLEIITRIIVGLVLVLGPDKITKRIKKWRGQ